MKRIFGVLLVAIFALSFTACSGDDEEVKYPKCKTSAHCASKGEVCVSGNCVECGKDADCAETGACMGCSGNQCVKKDNCCVDDSQCAGGLKCRAKPNSKEGTCQK